MLTSMCEPLCVKGSFRMTVILDSKDFSIDADLNSTVQDFNPDLNLNSNPAQSSGKQRLIVIGNGMAGARAVEEILLRGGAEQFAITMFGDEPYGNYNRILLSNVLNGAQDAHDIFMNPLEWYVENDITLHAGVRVKPSTAKQKRSRRQTGMSSATIS